MLHALTLTGLERSCSSQVVHLLLLTISFENVRMSQIRRPEFRASRVDNGKSEIRAPQSWSSASCLFYDSHSFDLAQSRRCVWCGGGAWRELPFRVLDGSRTQVHVHATHTPRAYTAPDSPTHSFFSVLPLSSLLCVPASMESSQIQPRRISNYRENGQSI